MPINARREVAAIVAWHLAAQHWNADRAKLRQTTPGWDMPTWSRAPAWRRRPYVLAAEHGLHPDDVPATLKQGT